MSLFEVFKKFYPELVQILPMEDSLFTAKLFSKSLLPGDQKEKVKSLPTRADKAAHFLDYVVKPIASNSSFENLLKLMEESEYNAVQELANQIMQHHASTALHQGSKVIASLSDKAKQLCIRRRQKIDRTCWPRIQTKDFIPLVLIQHQNQYTRPLAIALAEVYQSDHLHEIDCVNNSAAVKYCRLDSCEPLGKVINTSKATQKISEILAPLENQCPQFILIQGAPGIGKSFLMKEIAYRWGKGELLQEYKLVILVCLRDPFIRKLKSISDLLNLTLCKGEHQEKAEETASECSDYLFEMHGKDIVFLFDGYDELSQDLREDNLIADILDRDVLPNCGIIISSRPHASVYLQEQADVTVEVLGFTETDRKQFIEQALKGQPKKIHELTQYLDFHLSVTTLCMVPFNMSVLVMLYKDGFGLPKNSTELYNKFISATITSNANCHLKSTTDLYNLPQPYNRIVKQLSKLSFESLNDSKLTFTQDEIEAACPDITATPNAINGFGLLQAITHFSSDGPGETMSFNFTHLSIQEFLAAYYISHLPPTEELQVLKDKFWSSNHFNVFAFYVALTNGQHPSFKEFLSDKNTTTTISEKFLQDQLKCFRLFKCFYEAGDMSMCQCIEEAKTFNNRKSKRIELTDNRFLSLNNLECIALFMTHSVYKQWDEGVNFYRCYIQDHGIRILHHRLVGAGITINQLWLDCNGLTSSSSALISDIVVSCKIKNLWIDGNETIGENETFYGMLSDPSSELEALHMSDTKLSSAGAIKLFIALVIGNKLKLLWITFNDISDEACDTIAATLKDNTSLIKLNLGSNPISAASAQHIVKALQHNNTLKELKIPRYTEGSMNTIVTLVEDINKKRVTNGCQVKLYVKFQ